MADKTDEKSKSEAVQFSLRTKVKSPEGYEHDIETISKILSDKSIYYESTFGKVGCVGYCRDKNYNLQDFHDKVCNLIRLEGYLNKDDKSMYRQLSIDEDGKVGFSQTNFPLV